jgi:RNA recognition motif-containing protein
LPYEADEQNLRSWFNKKGFPVNDLQIVVDRFSGQPRGFAFVEMDEQSGKRCVRACNGRAFLDRNLVVNEAHPLSEQRPGPRLERAESHSS